MDKSNLIISSNSLGRDNNALDDVYLNHDNKPQDDPCKLLTNTCMEQIRNWWDWLSVCMQMMANVSDLRQKFY